MNRTRILDLLRNVFGDARFGLRLMRRNPGFSATVLTLLVVGIGATTAMFSLVMSFLVRPLPYPEPEQLTSIATRQPMIDISATSVPDFLDWKAQATSFESMAAAATDWFGLASSGELPENVPGVTVTGEFFDVFQVKPVVGRFFGRADDRIGAPHVAVISASLWRKRFAADAATVGRSVTLNSEPYTIIGVAPDGFRFGSNNASSVDVWAPMAAARRTYAIESSNEWRGAHFVRVVGRRKAGVSIAQAQAELSAIAADIATRYPDSNQHVRVTVADLHDVIVRSSRDGIWILFAAVALVFGVMCANVANLLLARASARRPEMAARAALGATRRRLIAQLLTETVVLFLLGAVGGTVLAHWLVDLFAEGLIRDGGAWTIPVAVDGTALAFSSLTAIACGIVFGLLPAGEAARLDPQAVLKETGTRASLGPFQRFVRGGLVIVQVAVALALLAGSGLAVSAFVKLASTPLGFDADELVIATVALPESKYQGQDEKMLAFEREALAKVGALPGVVAAAMNTQLPFAGTQSSANFSIEGSPPWPEGHRPLIEQNLISPGYFKTMGIPLLRGRDFDDGDVKDKRMVTIVNQRTVDKFFPGVDPIGKRITMDREKPGKEITWLEIVGVVGDVRRYGPAEPIECEAFFAFTQIPTRWLGLVVRTTQPARVLDDLPKLVSSLDAEQAIATRGRMSDRVARSIRPQRFMTKLLAAFAAVALILATLGIFGLVSYTTSQRTRELGIRLALGASPERVVAIVMREGISLLGIGLLAGLAGAILVGRGIAARLAGAAPFDALVFATILGVLALAGTLASLLPALRAVRIPPAAALRYE